jgi:hypothetical protein
MHAKRGIKKSIKKERGIIPTDKRILRQQIWICVTNLAKKIWPVGSGKTCFYGFLSVKIIIKLLITLATLTHVCQLIN